MLNHKKPLRQAIQNGCLNQINQNNKHRKRHQPYSETRKEERPWMMTAVTKKHTLTSTDLMTIVRLSSPVRVVLLNLRRSFGAMSWRCTLLLLELLPRCSPMLWFVTNSFAVLLFVGCTPMLTFVTNSFAVLFRSVCFVDFCRACPRSSVPLLFCVGVTLLPLTIAPSTVSLFTVARCTVVLSDAAYCLLLTATG